MPLRFPVLTPAGRCPVRGLLFKVTGFSAPLPEAVARRLIRSRGVAQVQVATRGRMTLAASAGAL